MAIPSWNRRRKKKKRSLRSQSQNHDQNDHLGGKRKRVAAAVTATNT
tara:strand:+ start:77 stop:217 length:141 start_codon:yes stop_codon:yes gene_type:complete